MKTWEMVKALTENPKLKFRERSGISAQVVDSGVLKTSNTCSGSLRIIGNESIEADTWELVREPVDFMTAVNSGKEIKYESWHTFSTISEALHILSDKLLSTAQGMINGKWYIE